MTLRLLGPHIHKPPRRGTDIITEKFQIFTCNLDNFPSRKFIHIDLRKVLAVQYTRFEVLAASITAAHK
jgi:hypothetical protein